MTDVGRVSWRDVADTPRVLAIPVGSCEQHGPHLPLTTDTIVAEALALHLSRRRDVLVGPSVSITASGEHAGFPGTLSIGTEVLTQVLVEIVRSADWAGRVVFVNGHGGNLDAVDAAATLVTAEGRRLLVWWPPLVADPRADAHAGWTETSLLLHLAPQTVQLDRAEAGDTRALADVASALRAGGVKALAPNGVLGDPSGACPDDGRRLFEAMSADLVARFDAWWR